MQTEEKLGLKMWKERSANIMLGAFLGIAMLLIILATICNHDKVSFEHLQKVEPDSVEKMADGGSVVELTLDERLKKRTTVAFFTSHQYVDAYVDGQKIYSLKETAGKWGHTTGNVWNFVLLPVNTTHLTVKISPCYPETANASLTYYVGNGREIYTGIMRKSLPTVIISFIILIVGIYMLAYWWLVHKSGDIDATLMYLGLFSIFLGLWTANETDVAVLLMVNLYASTFAAFILLMVMPVLFVMFVRCFLDLGDKKIWRILCDTSMIVCAISCVLHFTGIWEFRQSLILTHILIVGGLIYLTCAIVIKIVKKQVDRRLRTCIMALVLVIIASIADLINYYKVGGNTGIWGRISFLIFIAILGVESASKTLSMLKRGRRAKELEQFALNDTMTGLYNRNAYNHYVKSAPDITDTMIVTFDLNNLKKCNDEHGHNAGDEYIIHTAQIIESIFEKYGKCYRIGGDEFCCIVPDANKCQVERLIQRMHEELVFLNNKKIIPIRAEIACGYAVMEAGDDGIEQIRERADIMMYRDKSRLKQKK